MSINRYVLDGAARRTENVTILETGEVWSVDYVPSFPGSASTVTGVKGEPIGQTFTRDANEISATFVPTLGNAQPILQEYTFVAGGKGYVIPGSAGQGEADQILKFTATCRQVINGLITSPARAAQVVIEEGVAITPIPLAVSADTASGGTWAVSGITGLTVTGTNITGTPTVAGAQNLVIRYTNANGMVIERGFPVTVAT
jgi:hypothetical protein